MLASVWISERIYFLESNNVALKELELEDGYEYE